MNTTPSTVACAAHTVRLRGKLTSMFVLAVATATMFAEKEASAQSEAVQIRSLSQVISGGDALIEVQVPPAARGDVTIVLNGRDVTSGFHAASPRHPLIGRVDGLQVGRNGLAVKIRGAVHGELTLVNHQVSGPIISGPHQTPFVCETGAFGLGDALDADCSVTTRVDYFYRSTAAPTLPSGANPPDAFRPFDPNSRRPSDMAMTTTTEGRTVPYIVRREMGTINRAVYIVAFLHEPGQPLPSPWGNQSSWNGRLVYSFGAGCGGGHHQGRSVGGIVSQRNHFLEDGQLSDYALAKGYAVASSSLNVFGTTCNDVLATESMMMVKEHFIEAFGMPRFTIGSGRSGGGMQQYMIANNYPGLLDGIIPTAAPIDAVSFIVHIFDCELLEDAFASSPLTWTEEQKVAVAGQASFSYCTQNAKMYPFLRPTNCDRTSITPAMMLDAANPRGVRCTFQDNMVNVYGRDPQTGFARRPFDNVGIQYGLAAFNAGKITVDQFLDLNARIGGHDIDGNVVGTRMVADPEALRIAYQTGRLNNGRNGLVSVPIYDVRPYVDGTGDVHDILNSYIARARLTAANGRAANQVFRVWPGNAPIPRVQADVLDSMDEWLRKIKADSRPAASQYERVVRNKPPSAVDSCYTPALEKVNDTARCLDMYPMYSNARLVAGMPLADDIVKCQLRPVSRGDYKRPLDSQHFAKLNVLFPQGVCDYARKGVGQPPHTDTWLSYPRPGVSVPIVEQKMTDARNR